MDSFEAVYQAYFGEVYAYALRLCGQKHLAEDLTSETFLKAMDKLDTFRGEAPLPVWLCSIARNLYYSYLRKQGRIIPVEQVPEIWDGQDVAHLVAEKELATSALIALSCLPVIPRRVFLMRALGGLPFARIGSLFGKGENWACVTYHRARKSLQERLKEKEHEQ